MAAQPSTHVTAMPDVLDVIATDIRPNAVVSMVAAQEALRALRAGDVRRGGLWLCTPRVWQRFDRPWAGPDEPAGAQLVGSIYVTFSAPTAYDVVIHHATVTPHGRSLAWTPTAICNAALAHVGMTLADCGRTRTIPTPHRPLPRR